MHTEALSVLSYLTETALVHSNLTKLWLPILDKISTVGQLGAS